jgi:hypothetical protein
VIIQERKGRGVLLRDGNVLHRVTYEVFVQQIEIPPQPAFRKVHGRIALHDGGAPPITADRFVLALEDGAKLDMYIGEHGTILPAGGLYK